ncbi:MAG TPA: hypothetical protein VMV60_14670 [Thermoanaerobaculia bacterium]|nr:hypothetical protein [Thermoanaerobaculia bacterium]
MNPATAFPGLLALLGFALPASPSDSPRAPGPKIVLLEPGDRMHLPLLGGPPETATLRSGLVTLAPAHTKHDVVNTGKGPLRYIHVVAKAE